MDGKDNPTPQTHHNRLQDAVEAAEGLVRRLDELQDKISGQGGDPAPGTEQLKHPSPSLAEMLENGPDRIFDAVSKSQVKIEEIERALFGE